MTKAPKRIWIAEKKNGMAPIWRREKPMEAVGATLIKYRGYVRADLVDALIVAMAMEDAAQTPAEKDRAGAMRDRAMSEAEHRSCPTNRP